MTTKFSYSQALLALAIAYFAYALLSVSQHVPSFISALDRTTPHIDTIVGEVSLVREEVSQVRAQVAQVIDVVEQQLPTVLARIDKSLPLVEQGLAQSEYYTQQFPILWQHLTDIETQLTQVQQELPNIYKRIDTIVQVANVTTDEVAKWRPHSTEYLAEIKRSREDIPRYLTRVEYIVHDAKSIGKDASSGLVSGFFKGVISLPFEVVSGLAGIVQPNSKSAKLLTADDVTIMQEQTLILLDSSSQKSILWHGNDSANRGRIVKDDGFIKAGFLCHNVTFTNDLNGQKETLKQLMCQDKKGLWKVTLK